MPAGACVVFLGTLLHRGGANRSGAPRLAFSNQYCEPWARTQENYFLGVPAAQVRRMSPRIQQLLGYDIWAPFMGHVSASHPLKRSEEHTSELQSLMRISYAVFCLKKKTHVVIIVMIIENMTNKRH